MFKKERVFDSTRVNERIRIPEVRVIGPDGSQMGIFQTRDALAKARELGYDLVEISPNARPPVCKIMDYGKYKYELSKKQHEAKKKQAVIHVKEMRMRPSIGEHDLKVKTNHIKRFLEDGDKAKITIKFRGREIANTDAGRQIIEKVLKDLEGIAEVEKKPYMEGRALCAVVAPKKK